MLLSIRFFYYFFTLHLHYINFINYINFLYFRSLAKIEEVLLNRTGVIYKVALLRQTSTTTELIIAGSSLGLKIQ